MKKQYYLYTNDLINGAYITGSDDNKNRLSLEEFRKMADEIIESENPEYISIISFSKKNCIIKHFERYREENHKNDLSYKLK